MRKVAYLDVVTNGKLALEGYLAHDALNESTLALTVLTYEGYLLTTMDGKGGILENEVITIALGGVFTYHRVVAAALGGTELETQGATILFVDDYGHHLLELLDAALHLNGLGGLIAKALNEVGDIGNLLLLVLIGTELLLATLATEHYVFVVLDAVVVYGATGDLNGTVSDIIDEGAVVAHKHHGLAITGKEVFEPLDTLDIEVVGGLVEQEHIRVLEQKLGQLNTHAPSTRKL